MIVATTRRDVAEAAGALVSVQPWILNLESEHYGKKQKLALYRSLTEDLPRGLQEIAARGREHVLAKLGTPLEIQKFFDAMPTIAREHIGNPPVLLNEAVRRAHHESIERTVIDQIEARSDLAAAAVIWALLKLNDNLSIHLLRQLEEDFSSFDSRYDKGLLLSWRTVDQRAAQARAKRSDAGKIIDKDMNINGDGVYEERFISGCSNHYSARQGLLLRVSSDIVQTHSQR